MGADGILAYGVVCTEDVLFPWNTDERDSYQEWWLKETGFHPPCEPYTPDGEFAPGFMEGDPRIADYWASRDLWLQRHPIPAEPVNYCSDRDPLWALVVPGRQFRCELGYPVRIGVEDLLDITSEERYDLMNFIAKYGIPVASKRPQWLLMSWGS